MAVVIKSNVALRDPAAAVGNIHGYGGPGDYAAMLDFSANRYIVGGQEYDFSDVVGLVRGSPGQFVDIFGRTRTVPSNAPRFQHSPSLNVSGLLLERTFTNGCQGDAHGSGFTVSNAGESILVSWAGDGEVTPVTDGLTLFSEVFTGGRTNRFYTRSGAKSGTISVSGSVRDVMVGNSNIVQSFTPLGTRPDDICDLIGPALAPIVTGTFTVVLRYCLIRDRANEGRTMHFAALNGAAPAGAVRAQIAHQAAPIGTGQVRIGPDGSAINTGVQTARNLGNRAEVNVSGLVCSNFGELARIICYGQVASGTAAEAGATAPTSFNRFIIGSLPAGIISAAVNAGIILTHAVIYDRAVSEAEALRISGFGA